jgi:hypothetical protein
MENLQRDPNSQAQNQTIVKGKREIGLAVDGEFERNSSKRKKETMVVSSFGLNFKVDDKQTASLSPVIQVHKALTDGFSLNTLSLAYLRVS